MTKKNSNTKSSKNISQLCEQLSSDFDAWEKIPTKVKKDDKKQREELYKEIKQKIDNLRN